MISTEPVDRRADIIALLVVAMLAMVVKVPTLSTPAFWDEAAWLGQAGWLAANGLSGVMPGMRPDAQFFGHPPGLHFAAAVLFRMFGASVEVAHGLIVVLGALGVCGTYALVRTKYDTGTALLAALLVLCSPAWFSSAGVFLADLPVSALGVLSAAFAIRGRIVPYVITASCMVLIKETAAAIVAAVFTYRLLTDAQPLSARLRRALPYASPLLALALFALIQKAATGRFFYIYDFETDALFDFSIGGALTQAVQITRWIFLAQFRWLLTAAILVHLATNPAARRANLLLLLCLVAVVSGYSFSALFYMPRYVLPVLPFFYALGAVAVMGLAATPRRQLVAGGAVLAATVWSLASDPYRGHGEDNMHYRRIALMHRTAARDLAARYPAASIVAAWPIAAQLTDPLLGYVSQPLHVTWFANEGDLFSGADVAVTSRPANDKAAAFEAVLLRDRWRAVSTVSDGEHAVQVFKRP